MTAASGWLRSLMPARPAERRAALWAFAYFFSLLAAYYVLRPLRDQMAIAGGIKALPWLFTATFVTLLMAQPLYSALVARLPRRRFIVLVYHFFAVNLALFWALLVYGIAPVAVARVFFVWLSVFSLFAVAVFWSFMADLFDSEQGMRLFGFIGAGGTAGALLGPVITLALAGPLGPSNLLLVALVLLEAAVVCVHRLERTAEAGGGPRREERVVGGSAFAAVPEIVRSPYLLGLTAWVGLQSFGATMLYFAQANAVAAEVHGAAAQTRVFASVDLAVGVLTLATQVFATGQLLARFGTGRAAAALPALYWSASPCSASARRSPSSSSPRSRSGRSTSRSPTRRVRSSSPSSAARRSTRRRASSTSSSTAAPMRSSAGCSTACRRSASSSVPWRSAPCPSRPRGWSCRARSGACTIVAPALGATDGAR